MDLDERMDFEPSDWPEFATLWASTNGWSWLASPNEATDGGPVYIREDVVLRMLADAEEHVQKFGSLGAS